MRMPPLALDELQCVALVAAAESEYPFYPVGLAGDALGVLVGVEHLLQDEFIHGYYDGARLRGVLQGVSMRMNKRCGVLTYGKQSKACQSFETEPSSPHTRHFARVHPTQVFEESLIRSDQLCIPFRR